MKTKPVTIRSAATTLTGSLVASDAVDCRSASRVTVELVYTKGGGATLLEVHPEVSLDEDEAGSTWVPAVAALSVGTPASGAVAIEAVDATYTVTATGNRVLHFEVWGAARFRVKARETGTPGGTCGVRATITGGV